MGTVGGARAVECIERELKLHSVLTFRSRQRPRRGLMTAQCIEAFRAPSMCAGILLDRGVQLCLDTPDRILAGRCMNRGCRIQEDYNGGCDPDE
ncbi:hypothetical protein [Bradyrhizobium liaoningense]